MPSTAKRSSAVQSDGTNNEAHVKRTIVVIMLAGSTVLLGACRKELAPQRAAATPVTVTTAPVTSTALVSGVDLARTQD